MVNPTRKYYLDWLRILAFILLIVFHVGLMYSTWSYVFKSPRLAPSIEWVLFLFYPWRILILFFISGVACRFLIDKLGALSFSKDRVIRLFPVLVFGTLAINPTQNYFEALSEGTFGGDYLDFLFNVYLLGDHSLGKVFPTWDHLWFLAYLLVYALVLAATYSFVSCVFRARTIANLSPAAFILIPAVWLIISNYLVEQVQPPTFDFVNDWAVHFRSGGVFLAAVVLAKNSNFWSFTTKNAMKLGCLSLLLLVFMAAFRGDLLHSTPISWALVTGTYAWFAMLTLFGWAAKYLNRPSPALSYLTAAILPIYVLHQPIMIALAYCLFPMNLVIEIEGLIIFAGTIVFSLLLYEVLIKRIGSMRILFGLKSTQQ